VTGTSVPQESWVERAVGRSAAVQRSRTRIANQVRLMLDAARRLIGEKDDFTTQELVAEAGVALQTFYRYFASKDELLLAVIGDAMTEACDRWVVAGESISDPMERLRFFITAPLDQFRGDNKETAGMRFITSAHWHLHRIFPNELAEAGKPLVDLMVAEINNAAASGLLRPRNPKWDAWLIVEQMRAVCHYYAYAPNSRDELAATKENLWQFCRTALRAPRE
jgi:AcrR family transcriptional regulator